MKEISISFSCRSFEENVNLENSALSRSIFVKNQPANFDFLKKKFLSGRIFMNLFHRCIMILKKMWCWVQNVLIKRKKQLMTLPKRRMPFYQLVVQIGKKPW